MPAFLAVLSGIIVAITIAQNGDLALYFGSIRGTVIVHLVGLVTILLWMLLRRDKFHWDTATPWYGYLGGVMGVLTVYGCNLGFATLGVSVSVALMLLGQTLLGAAIDQFGLLGAQKRPFQPQHLFSFLLVIGGIVTMIIV